MGGGGVGGVEATGKSRKGRMKGEAYSEGGRSRGGMESEGENERGLSLRGRYGGGGV